MFFVELHERWVHVILFANGAGIAKMRTYHVKCFKHLLLYFFWRTPRSDDRILGSLALLLAGIVGNVTDRLRLGFVVDFIDVQFGSWHYPTFNVADAAICVGAGLLILDMFLSKRKAAAPVAETK